MENGWKMGGKTETGGPFHCISVAFDAVFSHTVDAACNKSDENKNKTFAIFNYSSEKRRKKFAVCFNYRAKSETESKKSSRVFHIFPFFIYIHIYIFFSLMRRTLMKELQRRLHRNYGNMEIKKSEIILVLEGIAITPFSRLPLEFLVGWLDGWLLGKWKCIEACNGNSASEKSTHTAAAALYLWRAMRG